MRWLAGLYEVVTLPVSLALGPLFMLKARGRARIWERYGIWNLSDEQRPLIWFHGASFGEVNGLLPVIREMRTRFPEHAFLLTSTSVTGLQRGEKEVDHCRLLPFDNTVWLASALKGLKLSALVLGETEIWPGLLAEMQRRTVPVCIVNGIISDFTFSTYQRMRPLLQSTISSLALVLTGNARSLERYLALGALPERVRAVGNSKYDVRPSISSREQALELKQRFFNNERAVLVLGSLRPGEETVWFEALREYAVKGEAPGICPFNVVVAPRHREKFDYFATRLEQYDLVHRRWSRIDGQRFSAPEAESIVLLDTMGMLEKVYSFADLVFVGGTLENFGGHNPLEPAAYGACVVLGPHTAKITDVVECLERRGALCEVRDVPDARALLEMLIENRREVMIKGALAREVWQEFSGAAGRLADELCGVIQQ